MSLFDEIYEWTAEAVLKMSQYCVLISLKRQRPSRWLWVVRTLYMAWLSHPGYSSCEQWCCLHPLRRCHASDPCDAAPTARRTRHRNNKQCQVWRTAPVGAAQSPPRPPILPYTLWDPQYIDPLASINLLAAIHREHRASEMFIHF